MHFSYLDTLEKSQLPTAQAKAILQIMELERVDREQVLATKSDLIALKAELKSDIRDTEHRLELQIQGIRNDINRSNFAFWIAQIAIIAGLLKLLVR